jgi:electron transfer flavoprotein beta subunit
MGIKKAKTKEVKRLSAAELGVPPEPRLELERVYMPQRSKQTVLIEGSAKEQAAKLASILKHEVRVL